MQTKSYPQVLPAEVEGLRPFGRRARTHSAEQIEAIARAIDRFGFINPILLDEAGLVLCGWGRVLAARLRGVITVPSLRVEHLSQADKRAYVIADNKLALLAGWDEDLLKVEFEELAVLGYDLTLTGFSDDELNALLLPNAGQSDPDDVPPLPVVPVARLGDIWICGRHRIICGDCTDSLTVARLFDGAKPHLMVTDPPYGVNYDPSWRTAAGLNGEGAALGKVANDHRADWREAWALFPGSVAYVWHSGLHCPAVHASLEARRMKVRAQIIWVKQAPVISRGHYHWQHEPAYYAVAEGEPDHWTGERFDEEQGVASYAVAEGETARWHGNRKQTTVWFIEHSKNDTGHGTQKPVECMRRPMLNNSKAGDGVYDPFLGSGSSLIAAEMTGRALYGCELNPAYVDVEIERWQAFSGAEVQLAGGKSFAAVSKARAKSLDRSIG